MSPRSSGSVRQQLQQRLIDSQAGSVGGQAFKVGPSPWPTGPAGPISDLIQVAGPRVQGLDPGGTPLLPAIGVMDASE